MGDVRNLFGTFVASSIPSKARNNARAFSTGLPAAAVRTIVRIHKVGSDNYAPRALRGAEKKGINILCDQYLSAKHSNRRQKHLGRNNCVRNAAKGIDTGIAINDK